MCLGNFAQRFGGMGSNFTDLKNEIKMEDLKEVARLILLQVDHNRECGKDDKFTLEEIADIIDRRVVKLFLIPLHAVVGQSELLICGNCNCKHSNKEYDGYCSQSCFDGIQ